MISNRVIVYTTHYIKPELIELQYNQFKKYCKDDYELVIVNNGKNEDLESQIREECIRLKLRCIDFEKNKNVPLFCSQHHTVCLENLLNNHIKKDNINNLTVITDNDVFPFKSFSFLDIINGKKIGGMYQQRNYSGIEHEYVASIFMMFHNDVDMTDFSFHNGVGDTGCGTFTLLKKYETEFTKHTAAIDIEKDYIFKNNDSKYPYLEKYRCQFIHDCFIHYYRASNWSESDPEYHQEKMKFLLSFLNDENHYGINLDDNVCYSTAHSDKGYNGIDHNYKNYKFVMHIKQ
jgi:hypothetical protein